MLLGDKDTSDIGFSKSFKGVFGLKFLIVSGKFLVSGGNPGGGGGGTFEAKSGEESSSKLQICEAASNNCNESLSIFTSLSCFRDEKGGEPGGGGGGKRGAIKLTSSKRIALDIEFFNFFRGGEPGGGGGGLGFAGNEDDIWEVFSNSECLLEDCSISKKKLIN